MMRFIAGMLSVLLLAMSPAHADTAWDFGGMFGYTNGGIYPNPYTNAASCPDGYSAYLVYGTSNVDWSMYFCGRQHVAGQAPLYDFGGMVGLAGSTAYYAVPWKGYFYYVNPFTHTDSCPPGYSMAKVLGTPNVDNNLFYCYRPHSNDSTSAVMYFGGMTGDGSNPYTNPATGTPLTCPAGYTAYPALGTPNVDYRFFYCGQPQNASTVPAGAGSLGIGEEMVEDANLYSGWTISAQVNALNGNGINARVVRLWTLSDDLLQSPTQVNTTNMALAQEAVSQLQSNGITVIAMDGRYPAWMTGGIADYIPCRNTTPGSAYETFLSNYAQARATMAQALPTIQFWEPANETNGLLLPDTSPADNFCPGHLAYFTPQESAAITTDLMYAAHAAIHGQIPNAVVFMPPPSPTEPDENGNMKYDGTFQNLANFVSSIYADIDSGSWPSKNHRDYFDGGSWHPYILGDATTSTWVTPNNTVYNVFTQHGDGSIPMIFSETGYSVCASTAQSSCPTDSQATAATWMADAVTLSQENFPWLTYFIYFRAFQAEDTPGYGIMSSPSPYPAPSSYPGTWLSTATSNPNASGFCYFTGCNYPSPKP